MRFQKIVSAFLIGCSLFSLCACSEDPLPPPKDNDAYIVLQDSVADLYNSGVQKISDAKSYTMTGSYTSAAEVLSSSELASNLTPVEMTVDDGMFFSDCMLSVIDPHRTYFDGTRYYFEDPSDKYFTTTNDHNDFSATDYLPKINSEVVSSPMLLENPDGSTTISFKMAFNIYQSRGLSALLGISFDDEFAASDVRVTIEIDANGFITEFLLSFDNMTTMSDEKISQNISVSMMITNYDSAEVVPPADLDVYEDWTEEVGTDPTEPIGELTPEDLQ